MWYNKCVFRSSECEGKKTEVNYEVPFEHWYWPNVFICEYHKGLPVTWKDALNTRANIHYPNIKMTHTKELSPLQGLDFWIGHCEEIEFCKACNGTGEKGDCILSPVPCKECDCTGRAKIE